MTFQVTYLFDYLNATECVRLRSSTIKIKIIINTAYVSFKYIILSATYKYQNLLAHLTINYI